MWTVSRRTFRNRCSQRHKGLVGTCTIDMCVVCAIDMCIDMRVDMCLDMHVDMCLDMWLDTSTHMCMNVCIHVYIRHVFGQVCMDMCIV